MNNIFEDLKALIANIVSGEPAVTVGVLVSIVVWVAGKNGIILDKATVTSVLAPLVTTLFARFLVVPAGKVVSLPSGDPRGEHAKKTAS